MKNHHVSPNYQYRADIDGLRAIAVLSVVIFHAFPGFIRGGFIGVDVFFVISGYLISALIFENLRKGTFSCTTFYTRRIKRIFPALLLVLIVSYLFGWFLLLPDEYQQLGKYIAAGSGFSSNLITLQEAGYFDNSAATKPLLHLWSLGVEEQFYIIWPLFVYFGWSRKLNLGMAILCIAGLSFYLNIENSQENLIVTFYAPHTRFWELLTGSLLAWVTFNKDTVLKSDSLAQKSEILINVFALLGVSLLIVGFWIINKHCNFPGHWALLPVLGTVFLIAAGTNAWFNRIVLSSRILVWFGIISYPLYLWHWPLLSFAHIINGAEPSKDVRITLIMLSIMLAWVTYQFIERPVRFGRKLGA